MPDQAPDTSVAGRRSTIRPETCLVLDREQGQTLALEKLMGHFSLGRVPSPPS